MSRTPFYEVNLAIQEMGGQDLNKCLQCGLCAAVCPWREVESPFFIRKMIRQGQLGLEGYEKDEILFACTTCNRCVLSCPREVKIIDVVRSMRSMVVEAGAIPESLKTMIGSCHSHGNPWSGERGKRGEWAQGLDVPVLSKDTEYFLFVCCTACYDIRMRNLARSMVKLFQRAGVSFGVIGEEESCCGESLRKVGDEQGFMRLAQSNVALFQSRGVKKIVTISPHCYYAFSREYRPFGADFEVIHSSQLLRRWVSEGRLSVSTKLKKKITYHDPCYLGRHMTVFQEPREIIAELGGEFVEMDRHGKFSLCCGGGGGRLWMETRPEERFSILRVEEARHKGAEIIATACPYCIALLEDALKTQGLGEEMAVKDLSELLAEGLEG